MKNIRAFLRWLFVIPVIAFSIVGCSSTINEWLGERPDTYHYARANGAFEDAFHKAPDPDKRIVIDAFDQLLAANRP